MPVTLISAIPSGQRSLESILLDGSGFLAAGGGIQGSTVHVRSMDGRPYAHKIRVDGSTDPNGWSAIIEHGSTTQIVLRIGFDIEPGKYAFQVETVNFKGEVSLSGDFVYEVAPWRYIVNSLRMRCLDESNEWSDSDEVVWSWCVGGDEHYITKISDEYEVDAGGTYEFTRKDKSLLVPGIAVQRQLTIIVRLFEADQGLTKTKNFPRPTQQSRSVAEAFDKSIPHYGIVSEVGDMYSKLAFRTGDYPDGNNYLGERRQLWSVLDLMNKTSNPGRSFTGELIFMNEDSDGSHKVEYEVVRVDR